VEGDVSRPLLEVRDLEVRFQGARGFLGARSPPVRAVAKLSLELRQGETLAVIGESGCGKSSLGRAIAGLLRPEHGTVRLDGLDLSSADARILRQLRQQVQVVFQDAQASLNPLLTVGSQVGEGLLHCGQARGSQLRERVAALLEQVELDPQLAQRLPHQLSGGQRQRVAIARALALEPRLVVLDEPVSALDATLRSKLLGLLRRLQRERALAYLLITHDLSVARRLADRVAVMYLGRFLELAPVREIFEDGRHPYTQALLAAIPRMEPGVLPRCALPGDVPDPARPPAGCPLHPRCPQAATDCHVGACPPLVEVDPGHWLRCGRGI